MFLRHSCKGGRGAQVLNRRLSEQAVDVGHFRRVSSRVIGAGAQFEPLAMTASVPSCTNHRLGIRWRHIDSGRM